MPGIPVMTDKDYQAQDDAYTLARAEEIKADEGRLNAARGAAKKMADDEVERVKAMRKVAGQRPLRTSNTNSISQSASVSNRNSVSNGNKHNVFTRI